MQLEFHFGSKWRYLWYRHQITKIPLVFRSLILRSISINLRKFDSYKSPGIYRYRYAVKRCEIERAMFREGRGLVNLTFFSPKNGICNHDIAWTYSWRESHPSLSLKIIEKKSYQHFTISVEIAYLEVSENLSLTQNLKYALWSPQNSPENHLLPPQG